MPARNTAVALVHCPAWGLECPPYGVAVLKAYLMSKGYAATAYDLNLAFFSSAEPALKQQWNPDRHAFWMEPRLVEQALRHQVHGELERWIKQILDSGARVIGFSVIYSTQAAVLTLARRFKECDPSLCIVCGGPQAGRDTGGFELLDSGCVDYVIAGEGEETFVDLLACLEQGRDPEKCRGLLYRKGDRIIDTGVRPLIQDLAQMPFADYSDFDMGRYKEYGCIPISLSRGCPNKCEFCYEVAYWVRYRVRPAGSLLREVAHLRSVLPAVNSLWFHDSLVNGNMAQLTGFAQGLIDQGMSTPWHSQAVIRKEMTREVLDLLKRSGCRSLCYGLETASFSVLRKMGKLLALGSDLDRIVQDTYQAGIGCELNFMFGFPGETEEDFEITLNFLHRNKDFISMTHPSLDFCHFYKGTSGHKNPEKLGIVLKEGSPHWISEDGNNTYLTRMNRFERFLETIHKLGIPCSYPYKKFYLRDTVIGNYHYSYGNFEQAIDPYEAACVSDPPNECTLERLVECYARAGRSLEAGTAEKRLAILRAAQTMSLEAASLASY